MDEDVENETKWVVLSKTVALLNILLGVREMLVVGVNVFAPLPVVPEIEGDGERVMVPLLNEVLLPLGVDIGLFEEEAEFLKKSMEGVEKELRLEVVDILSRFENDPWGVEVMEGEKEGGRGVIVSLKNDEDT